MSTIIVQPCGGLCNRMRTVAGVESLARRLNRALTVIWTRDPSLNIRFSDIFTLPQISHMHIIECELSSLKYKLMFHLYKDFFHYEILDDPWVYKFARGKSFETWRHLVDGKNIFLISSADILFDGDYRCLFRPNMELLESLNTVSCGKDTIGIHIRRTDNVNAIKFSPTYLFISKLYEELNYNPNTRFYLATDDPKEEELFKKEFGNKIMIYEKHSLDRNNPFAVKDALVDLYN
ncbi:MAG: hypothetical protein IJ562_03560 [Prevotella sp.]|nr:hypothetical protein [Prevotella sp.]